MGAQLSKEQGHLHFGYYLEQDTLVEEIKEKEDAGGHSPDYTRPRSAVLDNEDEFFTSIVEAFEDARPTTTATAATSSSANQRNVDLSTTSDTIDALTEAANNLHVTWNASPLAELIADEASDDEDDEDLANINGNATGFASIYGSLNDVDHMHDHLAVDTQSFIAMSTTDHLIDDKQTANGQLIVSTTTDIANSSIYDTTKTGSNTAAASDPKPNSSSARPSMSKTQTQLQPLTFAQLPSSGALVGLCGARLRKLSPNIGLMQGLVCLQLCCNQLRSLPAEIGHLTGLRTLDLSGNQLRRLPETIGHLTQLTVLRVSRNRLQALPRSIGRLENLERLAIDRNRLRELPSEIGHLKRLGWMDVRWNTELAALPAELIRLAFLRRLRTTGCPLQRRRISHRERAADDGTLFAFEPIILVGGSSAPPLASDINQQQSTSTTRPAASSPAVVGTEGATEGISDVPQPRLPADPVGPPSLRELAARAIVRHQIPLPINLPTPLKRYLSSATQCTECNGPFFEHVHRRRRLFMKQYREIWLEYQLCSPHWATDRERIACLFGELPSTAVSSYLINATNQQQQQQQQQTVDKRRHSFTPNTLRQTTAMHTNDNVYLVNNTFSESASSSSTITPSQQRRHSTLRSLATRTLGRSSTLRRMSFLASDDVQTTTTIKPPVQETIPLISLFTPPPAPSVSIKQLDTTVKASSKMNRASLSIRRKRTSSRPTAMSIIGNNSNSTSNNNNNNSNTTNNSVNTSSNPSNSSNSGNITVNSSTIISTATITTIDINDSSINTLSGLVTSSGTSRTLPNITTTHTTSTNYDDDDPGFSPPNSPGAESILSAHDIDDVDPNATMNVTLPSDMSDRITATSTANTLLVSSPSTTSILSGYGHFTLSSPSSSSPMDGASPLSDGTTTIGRKTTLVGSIRRRLGARSRPSARSLRRAFVSGQTN